MNSSNLCDLSQEWDSGMYPSSTRTTTRSKGDENTENSLQLKKKRKSRSKRKLILTRPHKEQEVVIIERVDDDCEGEGEGQDEDEGEGEDFVSNSLAGDQRPQKLKKRLLPLHQPVVFEETSIQMIPPPTKQQSTDYIHHQQKQQQLHQKVKEELDQTIHLVETIDVMEAEIEKLQRQIKMQQEHIDDWKDLATMTTVPSSSTQSNLVTLPKQESRQQVSNSQRSSEAFTKLQRGVPLATERPERSFALMSNKYEKEKEKEKEGTLESSSGLSFSAKCVIGVGISTILLLGFIFICFKITKLCSKIEKSLEEKRGMLPSISTTFSHPILSHPSSPPPSPLPSPPAYYPSPYYPSPYPHYAPSPPQYFYPTPPPHYPYSYPPSAGGPQGFYPTQQHHHQQHIIPRMKKMKNGSRSTGVTSRPQTSTFSSKFNQTSKQPKTTLGRKMPILDDFI